MCDWTLASQKKKQTISCNLNGNDRINRRLENSVEKVLTLRATDQSSELTANCDYC